MKKMKELFVETPKEEKTPSNRYGSVFSTKEEPTTQSGTTHGYSVQARVTRVNAVDPITYNSPSGQRLLTTDWQTLDFWKGFNPAGVPLSKNLPCSILEMFYLMDRDAAVAMAYTFIAQNNKYFTGDLEVRLVAHEVHYSAKHWVEEEPELMEEHLPEYWRKYRKQPTKE